MFSKARVICLHPRPPHLHEVLAGHHIGAANTYRLAHTHRLPDLQLGMKRRVESGLDAAVAQVEETVILEDDCLSDPAFFRYCKELLEMHRASEAILSVSGNNFQFGQGDCEDNYYFSHYQRLVDQPAIVCLAGRRNQRTGSAYEGAFIHTLL